MTKQGNVSLRLATLATCTVRTKLVATNRHESSSCRTTDPTDAPRSTSCATGVRRVWTHIAQELTIIFLAEGHPGCLLVSTVLLVLCANPSEQCLKFNCPVLSGAIGTASILLGGLVAFRKVSRVAESRVLVVDISNYFQRMLAAFG